MWEGEKAPGRIADWYPTFDNQWRFSSQRINLHHTMHLNAGITELSSCKYSSTNARIYGTVVI